MTNILYGLPHSLYTGKARSYLVKAGVEFVEETPVTKYYNEVDLPKAGSRRGFPTLKLQNEDVIRDSTAIIDHFEAATGFGFSPTGLKQNFVSRLFDVIGMEGLLRPAMHYRWNFEEHLPFLKHHFEMLFPPEMDKKVFAGKAMNAMRAAAESFGVNPDAFELVESLYEEFLEKFDAHLDTSPYLLGHKPAIGDFGLIAPMFAHLGRDPAPLGILQSRALKVLRWVERMNRPNLDMSEFTGEPEGYLGEDEIPVTLIEVLKVLAKDFMPETRAAAACINEWLAGQENLEAGTTAERAVGFCEFEVRGQGIKAIAQPLRFYLLQRLNDLFDGAGAEGQRELNDLLEAIDMPDLMELRLTRSIVRQGNLEVWLA